MSEDLLDLLDIPDRLERNPDLDAYAAQHETVQQTQRSTRGETGPCHACGRPGADHCLRCERPVCANHQHAMYGLCTTCTRKEPHGEDEDGDKGRPQGLDLDWVE